MWRQFEDKTATLWAKSIGHLPQEPLKFALNAALESLPTNNNLHLWGRKNYSSCPLCKDEHQSLQHVLNGCSKAQDLRRYCIRHDNVLEAISNFIKDNLPQSTSYSVDLPETEYIFPQHIVSCQQRPDIVWWDDSVKKMVLAELTISYETSMDNAHKLKEAKYLDLVDQAKEAGYEAKLITLEVGSRGLINMPGFNQLKEELGVSTNTLDILLLQIIRIVILQSFRVWCCRNVSQ